MSLFDEAKEAVRSRLNHSIIGGAAIGWSIANWRVFIHAFGEAKAAEKIKAIHEGLDRCESTIGLVVGAALTLAAPWLTAVATWATKKPAKYVAVHESDITAMRLADQARLLEMRQGEVDALEAAAREKRAAAEAELQKIETHILGRQQDIVKAESELSRIQASTRAAERSSAKAKDQLQQLTKLLDLAKTTEQLEKTLALRAVGLLTRATLGLPEAAVQHMVNALRISLERMPGLASDAALEALEALADVLARPVGDRSSEDVRAAAAKLRQALADVPTTT